MWTVWTLRLIANKSYCCDSTLLISEGSDPVVRISGQPALGVRQTVAGGWGRPQWQPGQPLLAAVHHVSERILSWSSSPVRVRGV